jgi:hypothetical protein
LRILRTLVGSACGIVGGVALALPVFALTVAAQRAALQPPEEGAAPVPVEVFYYIPLLQCAITAGGFGGVIGALAGGVSAVTRTIRARDGFPPA